MISILKNFVKKWFWFSKFCEKRVTFEIQDSGQISQKCKGIAACAYYSNIVSIVLYCLLYHQEFCRSLCAPEVIIEAHILQNWTSEKSFWFPFWTQFQISSSWSTWQQNIYNCLIQFWLFLCASTVLVFLIFYLYWSFLPIQLHADTRRKKHWYVLMCTTKRNTCLSSCLHQTRALSIRGVNILSWLERTPIILTLGIYTTRSCNWFLKCGIFLPLAQICVITIEEILQRSVDNISRRLIVSYQTLVQSL